MTLVAEGLFALVLVALLASAGATALVDNLVHAVFWLAATLLLTSVVLVWLGAPFLAGVQILLYTGGVTTLMLFGVMLTHRDPEARIENPSRSRPTAAAVAVTLLAVILVAIWRSPELEGMALAPAVQTADIGRAFLGEQLLAFEVLSVLLLAAMIGAIVLARRSDP